MRAVVGNTDKLVMYRVRVGGKSDPGKYEQFETEGKARLRARQALEAMLPWCRMYSKDGETNLLKALDELAITTFTSTVKKIGAVVDPTTGTTVVVTLWKGPKL